MTEAVPTPRPRRRSDPTLMGRFGRHILLRMVAIVVAFAIVNSFAPAQIASVALREALPIFAREFVSTMNAAVIARRGGTPPVLATATPECRPAQFVRRGEIRFQRVTGATC